MIKVVGLLKRREGMTRAEFRDYYESTHRLIGEKYLKGYASKYMRRFVMDHPGARGSDADALGFDVILEIWYPDDETFAAASAHLATPEIAAEIRADEERLFDRSSMRFLLVDECESSL